MRKGREATLASFARECAGALWRCRDAFLRHGAGVRRRLSTIALFLAWLCANGAAWDAVQVVAWGRMFATYASYLPMAAALEKTFDGSKPCELCSIAQQGRDETNRQSTAAALGGGDRLVLTCEAATPLVIAAPDFAWPEVEGATGPTRTETVPVPPPRV